MKVYANDFIEDLKLILKLNFECDVFSANDINLFCFTLSGILKEFKHTPESQLIPEEMLLELTKRLHKSYYNNIHYDKRELCLLIKKVGI